MKKIISLILTLLVTFSFTACSKEVKPKVVKEKININVASLKGPTGMGMVKLLEDKPSFGENVEVNYSIESAPDLLKSKLLNKEIDIAALPTNLASIMYNKTKGAYQLGAVNTLGVLYVITSRDDIKSIDDLDGKKIGISSKGSVPDFIFNYILDKNHIENKNINYIMEHGNLAKQLISGDSDLSLLPEPFVTMVTMKNKNLKVALDVQEKFRNIEGKDSHIPMGCIVIRKEFAKNHPQVVEKFLKEYEDSIKWTNENVIEASKLIEKFQILPSAKMAELAIPKCNLVYMNSKDSKDMLDKFYELLMNFNPKSVGGKIPDENFYY
ncbi:MAG: ABC transporter substrate-binding protein [Anaeromicrobium sp.]|uniref:ABC transporter substrate-binding protein n=1 Tax=Anaeromicrobium sp. TaxID=1929132 RepID=UPI0025DC7213|nr:MqnA/MqnD/SBP family protein [Anaeromicrobium sp.]MCT4595922.1 ABC transporter substrate-binding protein [Anaeromicrobium sp.]